MRYQEGVRLSFGEIHIQLCDKTMRVPVRGTGPVRLLLFVGLAIVSFIPFCHSSNFERPESDRFVVNIGGKYGFIDGRGKIAIKVQYSFVRGFSEGLAVVARDGKWGYVDVDGKEVIPLSFTSASSFSEGVGIVDVDDQVGYVDHNGRVTMLPCVPYSANSDPGFGFGGAFSEGLLPVRLSNHSAYIDRFCNLVISIDATHLDSFAEGFASVSSADGKYGYIDHSGRLAIPATFDGASAFSEGLALVSEGDKWGYITTSGQYGIAPQFGRGSRSFHEGLAAVQIDSKVGYIDKLGAIVIRPRYNDAWDFSEGLASVQTPQKKRRRHGRLERTGGLDIFYIDHSGRLGIKSPLISAEPFAGGRAQVMIHGRLAYIDRTGRVIWQN